MLSDQLLRQGFDDENDFRSLGLDPITLSFGAFRRTARASWPEVNGAQWVRRLPGPGEIYYAGGRVIKNPLKINGRSYLQPVSWWIRWNPATGVYFDDDLWGFPSTDRDVLLEYMIRRMGLEKTREEARLTYDRELQG